MNQVKPKGIWAKDQWPTENSVEDAEIALMAQKDAITQFNIIEHESNTFYITLHFNWRPELIHLSTRRNKTEPRLFKDLSRLIAHIKEKYPQVRNINLVLNRRAFKNESAATEPNIPRRRSEDTEKAKAKGKVNGKGAAAKKKAPAKKAARAK